MKVTRKKISFTLFLIYIMLLLSVMFSCRTVKKEWIKENYQSKTEALSQKEEVLKEVKTSQVEITETLVRDFKERFKTETESNKETENENTEIEVNMVAEKGVEKTATIGDTTIKSNGANITASIKTSKESESKTETQIIELFSQLEQKSDIIQSNKEDINSLKSEIANLKTSQENVFTLFSKWVEKKGVKFWVITVAVLAILFFVYRFFRK